MSAPPPPPPPVQSISTLCFKSCLSLSVTDGSGSILTTCLGGEQGHSYVTHTETLLDGLTWTKKQVIEARPYRAQLSGFGKGKREWRILLITFKAPPGLFSLLYLWPFTASLRALVLWDPLAHILSLPTFSWLRREKSVCNQGPEALNLPHKIKLDETEISCKSHLRELFVMILSFPCRVESWPESCSGFLLCLVLIKLDHYKTTINIVSAYTPKLPAVDFCNRICQTMEEETHWTFISNTETGCVLCWYWSMWGELLVLQDLCCVPPELWLFMHQSLCVVYWGFKSVS